MAFRSGVNRGISYGLFGPPGEFVTPARALGAGLVRAYVYWAQVEPEPGRFQWDVVDALLDQVTDDVEVWLTVCSSSPWATRQATNFQPQSPAVDLDTYERFIRHLVRRGRDRVRYWQCNNEPSNAGLLWAGTAPEYVAQLARMHVAVHDEDPDALVVLGGCGYDVFSSPDGSAERAFFDHLVDAGRDAFDVFDIHLYGDPHHIPSYVDTARAMMRRYGYEKPILAGEHGGPVLFEFGELDGILQETFAQAFAEPAPVQSTQNLAAQADQETPERRALRMLYDRMPDLPPRLRMFLDGCPAELEARRHRINCRQLVVRTVLALAAGIPRTAYWQLAPEVPNYHDPYQMMDLLFGKLPLLEYDGTRLARRRPAADTFALLAERLEGAVAAEPVGLDAGATVEAFRVERSGRGPLLVMWDRRDWFDGEDDPPLPVTLPWPASEAVDALGDKVDATTVGATPVLVEIG